MSVACTGSPFQFTVGPITDGGAHKVRAIGPGLERGEVNRPSMLFLFLNCWNKFETTMLITVIVICTSLLHHRMVTSKTVVTQVRSNTK